MVYNKVNEFKVCLLNMIFVYVNIDWNKNSWEIFSNKMWKWSRNEQKGHPFTIWYGRFRQPMDLNYIFMFETNDYDEDERSILLTRYF